MIRSRFFAFIGFVFLLGSSWGCASGEPTTDELASSTSAPASISEDGADTDADEASGEKADARVIPLSQFIAPTEQIKYGPFPEPWRPNRDN